MKNVTKPSDTNILPGYWEGHIDSIVVYHLCIWINVSLIVVSSSRFRIYNLSYFFHNWCFWYFSSAFFLFSTPVFSWHIASNLVQSSWKHSVQFHLWQIIQRIYLKLKFWRCIIFFFFFFIKVYFLRYRKYSSWNKHFRW